MTDLTLTVAGEVALAEHDVGDAAMTLPQVPLEDGAVLFDPDEDGDDGADAYGTLDEFRSLAESRGLAELPARLFATHIVVPRIDAYEIVVERALANVEYDRTDLDPMLDELQEQLDAWVARAGIQWREPDMSREVVIPDEIRDNHRREMTGQQKKEPS